MQTILITGSSSGFGRDTARAFLDRGWRVLAAMRTPRPDVLPPSDRLRVLPLDVTRPESIEALAEAAGPVDALVNNAGVGILGVVEGTPMAAVRATFEANTFGAIAVTQAFLPRLRRSWAGVVVNVSSSTTLAALPMLAVYTASKAALEAFTASLALELAPVGVRAHVVLPGSAPETPFGQNARAMMQHQGVTVPEAYAAFAQGVFARMGAPRTGAVTRSADVVEAIWRAVTDPTSPVRLPAGADALALAGAA